MSVVNLLEEGVDEASCAKILDANIVSWPVLHVVLIFFLGLDPDIFNTFAHALGKIFVVLADYRNYLVAEFSNRRIFKIPVLVLEVEQQSMEKPRTERSRDLWDFLENFWPWTVNIKYARLQKFKMALDLLSRHAFRHIDDRFYNIRD